MDQPLEGVVNCSGTTKLPRAVRKRVPRGAHLLVDMSFGWGATSEVLRSYFLCRTPEANLWVVYVVVPPDEEDDFSGDESPLIYWASDLDDSKEVAERVLEAAWVAQVQEDGDFRQWSDAVVLQEGLITEAQAMQIIERLNRRLASYRPTPRVPSRK